MVFPHDSTLLSKPGTVPAPATWHLPTETKHEPLVTVREGNKAEPSFPFAFPKRLFWSRKGFLTLTMQELRVDKEGFLHMER